MIPLLNISKVKSPESARAQTRDVREACKTGNGMALDPGMGNCGKDGQWVPVGAGQPTVLIGGLTDGRAAA